MINDGLEFQVDIGSAQNIICLKYLIAAHQSLAGTNGPNKANHIAIYDHLDVRKNFVEIDWHRYPKDSIIRKLYGN